MVKPRRSQPNWIVFLLLALLAPTLLAQNPEGEQLGKELQAALQEYNKISGTKDFDWMTFWKSKNLVTKSLSLEFDRNKNKGFAQDPFLFAQEVVPGLRVEKVVIEGNRAKAFILIQAFTAREKPVALTYLLRKEDDRWRIDDIDYGTMTLRKTLLAPSLYD